MPATTYIARTETGTVTRSSATRTYAYAVLVKTAKNDVDDRPEGNWGWSGDYVNATKMARQAEKVYHSVRVVPVLRVQATEPAAMLDSSEKWHAVDLDGNVVVYGRTKADVVERVGRTRRAGDEALRGPVGLAGTHEDAVEAAAEQLEDGATYAASLVALNGKTRQQFAIVSGETAKTMLANSTVPELLRFELIEPAAVVEPTCTACGKPSPVEFCSRPECLTYGSGAIAAGPSIVSDTLRLV